jgi:hypothetical protein
MDQAEGAEIKGGVDERAEERRMEITKGTVEGDLSTGDLVFCYMVFSDMEVPSTLINVFNGSRMDYPVWSAWRVVEQNPQRERETIIGPPPDDI